MACGSWSLENSKIGLVSRPPVDLYVDEWVGTTRHCPSGHDPLIRQFEITTAGFTLGGRFLSDQSLL
jgi:hypothetical protein